jgi:hypothetical protein
MLVTCLDSCCTVVPIPVKIVQDNLVIMRIYKICKVPVTDTYNVLIWLKYETTSACPLLPVMCNIVWHYGLNNDVGRAIFLLFWCDYHRDLKITVIQHSHWL